jgi:hypothetical protein
MQTTRITHVSPLVRRPDSYNTEASTWGTETKFGRVIHLVPRLRMRGAIPPPPYVFMAQYLVKHTDNFTFLLVHDPDTWTCFVFVS